MYFNKRLAELRKENNITQEVLAELLNVSRQAVYKWESGKGYPTIDKLLVIKDYFNVSLDTLFTEEATHMEHTKEKNLQESFMNFYWNLSKKEKSALITFIAIITGILIFSSGILIGQVIAVLF